MSLERAVDEILGHALWKRRPTLENSVDVASRIRACVALCCNVHGPNRASMRSATYAISSTLHAETESKDSLQFSPRDVTLGTRMLSIAPVPFTALDLAEV